MPSLEHLIDHYTRFADGLPCSLVSPVGKMSIPPVQRPDKFTVPLQGPTPLRHVTKPPIAAVTPDAENNTETVSPEPKDLENNNPCPGPPPRIPVRARIPLKPPQNLKPIDRRKTYENNETLRRVRHSRDNIPLESIFLVRHFCYCCRCSLNCCLFHFNVHFISL
jgi:hypothetical protein